MPGWSEATVGTNDYANRKQPKTTCNALNKSQACHFTLFQPALTAIIMLQHPFAA